MAFNPLTRKSSASDFHAPVRRFREEFDSLFQNFFQTLPSATGVQAAIADFRVDVSETDKEVEVKAELPGVEEKDVHVMVDRDVLSISGEKKESKEEKKKNYHVFECSYGNFSRSLRLPFEPSSSKIKATFDKGVLCIKIDKPEELQKSSRVIEVNKQ